MASDRVRLDPTVLDRLHRATRPGWVRTLLVRRIAAAALLIGSVAMAVLAQRDDAPAIVVVATRDLTPGTALVGTDLTTLRVAPDLVPAGALRMDRDGVGRTVTGPIRKGEIMTDARLLSARLPGSLTGDPDARLVPIRLADDAVIDLLRAGDAVDVVTETPDAGAAATDSDTPRAAPPSARLLVRGAIVALVPHRDARTRAPAVVMLAMSEKAAHEVAAVALSAPVTVVFH
ncbi:SAF domain-containing protein [Williamsia sp. CHRR-6]|uniref:SAF domain-containing protein n=1 Tax=Williamsia sp. CHRR-6 TaxID=2835871 RepID=UPI001BD9DE31|nr:SAF domain-containing protein [Williamsia sp. CHRR-6]MBT0566608.1 flagellar biosynthesis protein FlgA [Williamsia sp. CHRR-6]